MTETLSYSGASDVRPDKAGISLAFEHPLYGRQSFLLHDVHDAAQEILATTQSGRPVSVSGGDPAAESALATALVAALDPRRFDATTTHYETAASLRLLSADGVVGQALDGLRRDLGLAPSNTVETPSSTVKAPAFDPRAVLGKSGDGRTCDPFGRTPAVQAPRGPKL